MNRPVWQRFLGPLAPASHLGIYIEHDMVHAAAAVPSLIGPRECDEQAFPLGGVTAAHRVSEIIRNTRDKLGKIETVVLGVPAHDVCLEARRATPPAGPGRVRGLETVGELAHGDGAPVRPLVQIFRRPDPHGAGQTLQVVVACRDVVLERLEALYPHGEAAQLNLEPVAMAAIRFSLNHSPPRRPGEIAVRVLTGPSFCVGYLLFGTVPLFWLAAPTHDPADRPRQVRTLMAGIAHHARSYLELEAADFAVEGIDRVALAEPGKPPDNAVRRLVSDGIDGRAIALGLALGACAVAPHSIHLHRQQRERRRAARRTFPWRDVAAGALALGTLATALELEARRTRMITAAWEAQVPPEGGRIRSLKELTAERDTLAQLRDQWTAFADRPLSWTHALTNLSSTLPDPVRLVRVEGRIPPLVERSPGQQAPHVLQVVTPEKHLTLGALLSDPYLKRAFPRVEVTMQVANEVASGLLYTLIAAGEGPVPDLPNEGPAPAATPDPAP